MANILLTAGRFDEAMALISTEVDACATAFFLEGAGASGKRLPRAFAASQVRWFLKLTSESVREIFREEQEQVQERWGAPLGEEKGLAWFLGHMLGVELLPEEVGAVGQRAKKILKAAKLPAAPLK